jgi:cytochrome c peroxidase
MPRRSWWLGTLLVVANALPTITQASSLGLPPLPAPNKAQVELGHQLFFDRRLSVNGTLSCAMCHVPAQGFTANELRTSVGMEGVSLRRNAPTLLNVAFVKQLFVDGRAGSLEAQALMPLVHPDEFANPNVTAAMRRIDALATYRVPMQAAFGGGRATPARVASALAAYQRTLIAAESPFDRWRFGGEPDALDATAQRGFALFQNLGCVACHTVQAQHALFSDGKFHNVGTQARSQARQMDPVQVQLVPGVVTQITQQALRRIGVADAPDHGRHEVTGKPHDLRAFRTPTLRNVALTAPYMHDGSLDTLDDVLTHYATGGTPSDPAQDPRIRPFVITAAQRAELIAFLQALTSPDAVRLGQSGPNTLGLTK